MLILENPGKLGVDFCAGSLGGHKEQKSSGKSSDKFWGASHRNSGIIGGVLAHGRAGMG